MELKNIINKEIFVKPDFAGDFYIFSDVDYRGEKILIKPNDRLGIVQNFIKSDNIPGVSFIVISRNNKLYYLDSAFIKYLYYSNLTGKTPEVVSNKINKFYPILLASAAVLILLFIKKK